MPQPSGSPLADFLNGVTGGFQAGYGFREDIKERKRKQEKEAYEREVAEETRAQRRAEAARDADRYFVETGRQEVPPGERRTPVMPPPSAITDIERIRKGVGAGLGELRRPPPAPGLGGSFPEAPQLRVPPGWMSGAPSTARPPMPGLPQLQVPEALRTPPPAFESSMHPGGYLKVGSSEEERTEERAARLRRETGAALVAAMGGRTTLTPEQAYAAQEAGILDDVYRERQQRNPFTYQGREFDTAEEVRRAKDVIEPDRPPRASASEDRLAAAVARGTQLERISGQAQLIAREGSNVDSRNMSLILRGNFPDADLNDVNAIVADVLAARDRAQRTTTGATSTAAAGATNEKGLTLEQWTARKAEMQGSTAAEIYAEIGSRPEGGAAAPAAPRDTLKPPRYQENPY